MRSFKYLWFVVLLSWQTFQRHSWVSYLLRSYLSYSFDLSVLFFIKVTPSCTFFYQILLHSTSFTMLISTIIWLPCGHYTSLWEAMEYSSPPSTTNIQECQSYHLGIISPQHLVIISVGDIWGDDGWASIKLLCPAVKSKQAAIQHYILPIG